MTEAKSWVEGQPAGEGWDPGLQDQIAELNAQLLDALRRCAHRTTVAPDSPLLAELAPLWRRLGEPALHAMARCPYLMLDAGFARTDCWDGAVHESAEPRADGWLAAALEPDLVRRTVMFGWHLARANPYAARLSLGMTAPCTRLIARLRLRDLEQLVERRAGSCRLRWEGRPVVWRQLLEAAATGSMVQLESLQLRGLQLLAAEFRRTT